MPGRFALGFTSLTDEIEISHLPVSGQLPYWLSGTLVRNGPGRFEVGTQQYHHWFDGLAMLHGFTLRNGSVTYTNKYLRSRDYMESMAAGTIKYSEFATDPCRTIFQRVLAMFVPAPATDNANVNIA